MECALPGCNKDRAMDANGRLHRFCSRGHYREALCRYPDCTDYRHVVSGGKELYLYCMKHICPCHGCNRHVSGRSYYHQDRPVKESDKFCSPEHYQCYQEHNIHMSKKQSKQLLIEFFCTCTYSFDV